MRRRLAAVIAAVAVLCPVLIAASASAQQGDGIRVIAGKLDTGDVELGVRQDRRDRLPEYRFFDYSTAVVGDWYETDPVEVSTPWGSVEVVVIVRRTATGRVEVDLDTFDANFQVGVEAPRSFDHASVPVGRWLRSGPAVLTSRHGSQMSPAENTEPASPSEPATLSWPPPEPVRPEPWPPPASAFWPAGTCALGPRHDPGGDILFCTLPGATDLRSYLDTFARILTPWYPWIGATLKWTGGYSIVADVPSGCKPHGAGEFVTGCYSRQERRIFLDGEALLRTPAAFWGETLVHELDHARWLATDARPSVRLLTWYDQSARIEVFAEAMAANTIGETAHLPRYTGRDGIPARPTFRDIHAAGEAVIEWCPIETCATPRLATEIVWAHPPLPQGESPSGEVPAQTAADAAKRIREMRERAAREMRWAQCNADLALLRSEADSLADLASDPIATDYWRRRAAEAAAAVAAKERECDEILNT